MRRSWRCSGNQKNRIYRGDIAHMAEHDAACGFILSRAINSHAVENQMIGSAFVGTDQVINRPG